MPKRVFRVREGEPLFDIVSYGRGGPRAGGARLTPAQVEQVRRTVKRAPEVVVKVLPGNRHELRGGTDTQDGNTVGAVERHLDYIGRYGELALETDEGELVKGRIGRLLADEWDLKLEASRGSAAMTPTGSRDSRKLVHKLMFSMPPGTPPDKVLGAVRNFAREEFGLQHRYAFVLHTDEAHPHVHLVLKAVSEQGVRLNISKAHLRHWREEFARNLRLLGVEANATERAARGESKTAKKDGIYRASLRGDSTYLRAQAEAVANELLKGDIRVEPGKKVLVETRKDVVRGWLGLARRLADEGHGELASELSRFVNAMPPPRTDREWIAEQLRRSLEAARSAKMERIR